MRVSSAVLLLCAACGGLPPSARDESAPAPLTASDLPDRACTVMLREIARVADGYAGSLQATRGKPAVLYRTAADPAWREAPATPDQGRFLFKLPKVTLTATLVQLAPFTRLADGTRLFDHNRNGGGLDDYSLLEGNNFAVQADLLACTPGPVLRFLTGGLEQRGALVQGGQLVVDYNLYRLPQCLASTYNGLPAWETLGTVRFSPGGQTTQAPLKYAQDALGTWSSRPMSVTVPADAQSAELWFYPSGAHCSSAWDSNYGANYRFEVAARGPAAPQWAGNPGSSFSRACDRRGFTDVTDVSQYTMERACMWIEADVYVPGLTDGAAEHPEKLLAQVEDALDGAPRLAWLEYRGRVGNDYRYRFNVDRGALGRAKWSFERYAFRFSTDGAAWLRLGQADGSGFQLVKVP